MKRRCSCGGSAKNQLYMVTCLECGAPCCAACTFVLEAVTYCAPCAESLLGAAPLELGAAARPASRPAALL